MHLVLKATNPKWDAEIAAAKVSDAANRHTVLYGQELLPDYQATVRSHDAQGFWEVKVESNIHGWCVRDRNNNGAGRMSQNYPTKDEALKWANDWYNEDSSKRQVFA